MLIEPNCPQQLIERPIEAVDCMLAPLQQTLFGLGPDADAEKIVEALDDLQWLSKIMGGHGEEHGLKIRGPPLVCPGRHSHVYWLARRPHDADCPGIGDSGKPLTWVSDD